MRLLRLCGATLIVALTLGTTTLTAAPATAAPRPCSLGLVALTFDDGPAAGLTRRLLDILRQRRVPATFFMVGERIDSAPGSARAVAEAGFTIGNHSYRHEQLTRLTSTAVRATLTRARHSAQHAGVPMSRLMRPPYGSVSASVRSVVRDLGMTLVLWTVDPLDWRTDRSTETITSSVLAQLRPHARNIVLQHDGVGNSPRSVAAVPRIIRAARGRGYCFAELGPNGVPVAPVPRTSVSDARVTERTDARSTLSFVVHLDRPTSRATSVAVRTSDGTAKAGVDYDPRRFRLRFPAGLTRKVVTVSVHGDRLDETEESLRLLLSAPSGQRVGDSSGRGRVADDDPPAAVTVTGGTVAEPVRGSTAFPVVLRLSRPSGRPVGVHVRTEPGTAGPGDFTALDARVTIPAGTTRATIDVPILADAVQEPDERLTVRVVSVANGTVATSAAGVRITQPPAPPSSP